MIGTDDGSAPLAAAGGLVWRPGSDGQPEVAVVHRPRYDDWSLPKGKPAPGEPLPVTAVREIGEETGHVASLGRRLPGTRYRVAGGDKTVHYWTARATGGSFTPNEEVDQLRWVGAETAGWLLSYRHDRALVAGLDGAPAGPVALLVRHAKAGSRADWAGDDDLRPLSAAGTRQAEELRGLLPAFGVVRLHSAPRTRCRQTVQGLADDLGLAVLDEPLLSEEGYAADPGGARRRLAEILQGEGPVAVCSQGGAIPHLVATLLAEAGLAERDVTSRKASFWVLSFGNNAERSPAASTLVAADYYEPPC